MRLRNIRRVVASLETLILLPFLASEAILALQYQSRSCGPGQQLVKENIYHILSSPLPIDTRRNPAVVLHFL